MSKTELLQELAARPGLIPVDLDSQRQQLTWADVEQFHFYEGFFHRSLKTFAALKNRGQSQVVTFISDLEALHSAAVCADSLAPSGLIFHAGRCGSTLLAKALARARAHLVLSEAAPHNQVWECLTGGWQHPVEASETNQRLYQHLLLATGRQRLNTHQAYFIKFTSFNILFFDFIRRVFPTVPTLFLYREPRAVLASVQRNPPGWLLTPQTKAWDFITGEIEPDDQATEGERALQRFLSAALQAGAQGLRYLAYEQLTVANLPALLAFFRLTPSPEQLRLMQAQFAYNAKQDFQQEAFLTDQAEKLNAVAPQASLEVQALYEQVACSGLNFFVTAA